MILKTEKWFSESSSSRNAILVYSLLMIVVNSIVITYFFDMHRFTFPIVLRIVHTIAFVIVVVMFLKNNEVCSDNTCTKLFVLLFLPSFVYSWQAHILFIQYGQPWPPFTALKLQLVLLAFLVPGSYKVNLVLMLILCFEGLILWYLKDLPHMRNVTIVGEPMISFIYVITCFTILAFRYRDQKLITKLIADTAKYEVHEKVAKVFLSMRDKSNTPLQTQKMIVDTLKKHFPERLEYIRPLENSVNALTRISNIMKRIEKNFPPLEHEVLLSEEEIIQYLDRIEGKNGSK